MRRILSVLLENESGALSRVIGLFSQRGYNIESLTVAPTDDPTLSRMTIQTVGDEKAIEQIEKQLHKLVDVLRVSELGQGAHVEREIMLVKVQASGYGREEVKRNTEIFRGQIIDVTPSIYTVQLAGTSDKLDAFLASLRDVARIVEVARSGVVGPSRGGKIMRQGSGTAVKIARQRLSGFFFAKSVGTVSESGCCANYSALRCYKKDSIPE